MAVANAKRYQKFMHRNFPRLKPPKCQVLTPFSLRSIDDLGNHFTGDLAADPARIVLSPIRPQAHRLMPRRSGLKGSFVTQEGRRTLAQRACFASCVSTLVRCEAFDGPLCPASC